MFLINQQLPLVATGVNETQLNTCWTSTDLREEQVEGRLVFLSFVRWGRRSMAHAHRMSCDVTFEAWLKGCLLSWRHMTSHQSHQFVTDLTDEIRRYFFISSTGWRSAVESRRRNSPYNTVQKANYRPAAFQNNSFTMNSEEQMKSETEPSAIRSDLNYICDNTQTQMEHLTANRRSSQPRTDYLEIEHLQSIYNKSLIVIENLKGQLRRAQQRMDKLETDRQLIYELDTETENLKGQLRTARLLINKLQIESALLKVRLSISLPPADLESVNRPQLKDASSMTLCDARSGYERSATTTPEDQNLPKALSADGPTNSWWHGTSFLRKVAVCAGIATVGIVVYRMFQSGTWWGYHLISPEEITPSPHVIWGDNPTSCHMRR